LGAMSLVAKCFDTLPVPMRCRIHTVVVFTILDGYMRRTENMDLFGTLLGNVSEGNIIEITDCFVVHNKPLDDGSIQVQKDQCESMYELKQKVNPKEQVIGWFSIGNKLTDGSVAFNSWFRSTSQVSKFMSHVPLVDPVVLMVDPDVQSQKVNIKAYVQAQRLLIKDSLIQFQEVPSEVYATEADKSGLNLLLNSGRVTPKKHEVALSNDGLDSTLENLLEALETAEDYVTQVLDGSIVGDPEIGRALSKALCSEPVSQLEVFDQMCQTSVQDSLMVSYLSTLARVQVAIAERLNTSFNNM